MKRFTRVLILTFMFGGLMLTPGLSYAADDAGWMFSPSEIIDVNIELSEESLDAIDVAPYTWVDGTFTMTGSEGREFGPVDALFRLKGNASFRPLGQKAAIKLKFKKPNRPWGLKKITFNNMVQDGSKIHETLSYEIFRKMGIAASRTGYATAAINGEDYGLYLNIEVTEGPALARWFDTTQHLYEGEGMDLLPGNETTFDVDEGDKEDLSDLQALIAAVNAPDPGWLDGMSDVAHIEQMVTMWAVEAFVGHWDGFTYNKKNYYIHSDADGMFSWMPWGTDQAFSATKSTYFLADKSLPGGKKSLLPSLCLANNICRGLYVDALERVRDTVEQEMDIPGRVEELSGQLSSYILNDPMLGSRHRERAQAQADAVVTYLESQSVQLDEELVAVPLAPEDVSAIATDDGIEVEWSEAQTYGAKPVSGYLIEYRTEGSSNYTEVTVNDPARRSALVVPPKSGIYEVQVSALSEAGSGAAGAAEPVTFGSEEPFAVTFNQGLASFGSLTDVTMVTPENPSTIEGVRDTVTGAVSIAAEDAIFPSRSFDLGDGVTGTVSFYARGNGLAGNWNATSSKGHLMLRGPFGARVEVESEAGSVTCEAKANLRFSTDRTVPYRGARFADGLEGEGAIVVAWHDLGQLKGDEGCADVAPMISGPGGMWLSHDINSPTPPAPAEPVELAAPTLHNSADSTDPVPPGRSLTCEAGQWSNYSQLTFVWFRDGDEFNNNKPNGTGRDNYHSQPSDAGSSFTCAQTARAHGSTTWVTGTHSNAMDVIAP